MRMRDRHQKDDAWFKKGAHAQNVEISQFSDDDVRLVCEIYWMDYLCVPFELPPQCNLTHLVLKYYGTHVVYDDCYEF